MKNVVEQPLKDGGIAMDGDVNLIVVRDLLETFVKVLHVLDEERAREGEVSLLVLAVVNHMDHYFVLELHAR